MAADRERTEIECPRCGQRDVWIESRLASACIPMPAMERLRCRSCGREGTKIHRAGAWVTEWDR